MPPQRCIYLTLTGELAKRVADEASRSCGETMAALQTHHALARVRPCAREPVPSPLTQESRLPGGLGKALDLGADTVAYGGVDTLGEDPRQALLDALERRRRCFDE